MTRELNPTASETSTAKGDLLHCATRDARDGLTAMHCGEWERAAIYFRLALDQMQDAGVLKNV